MKLQMSTTCIARVTIFHGGINTSLELLRPLFWNLGGSDCVIAAFTIIKPGLAVD